MHECGFPRLGHPSTRTGAATRTGVSENAWFAKAQRQRKKVEALFAELKESDRTTPSAPPTIEVRARAVLAGSGGAEHQATGPLPKPTDSTTGSHHHLENERKNSGALPQPAQGRSKHRVFQQPDYVNDSFALSPPAVQFDDCLTASLLVEG